MCGVRSGLGLNDSLNIAFIGGLGLDAISLAWPAVVQLVVSLALADRLFRDTGTHLCFVLGIVNDVNLFIFADNNFRVFPMECRFAAINFRVSLACLISYKEVLNFHGDLFLRKYLPREYRQNKSLAKLNRFTVIWYILFSL